MYIFSFDYFLGKCLFKFLSIFYFILFFGLITILQSSLYILGAHPLSDLCIEYFLSLCLAFLFSKWCLLKRFNFNKAQIIIFLNSKCFSQKFLPTSRSQRFFPKFLFLKFYGLSFYIWFKIHGKLYVYIVWGKATFLFFFFPYGYPIFPTPFFEKTFLSPIELHWPCQKSID